MIEIYLLYVLHYQLLTTAIYFSYRIIYKNYALVLYTTLK